ncbi:sulfite exporter TauE/SafE family protein [Flavobacterium luteum]|uniref:Probable membrane transporter protein n=1 Tax=Flavobacterium luteum TaxID=2026654 RepID=A0A7J5AGB9_9FLAO|nr:sulfite exporter TauE/SafE family protein [Flavobacterium luteum]KAB1156641.1 sulfite exporter TauE/SafE family protein [Flavobacterium luteum]
MAITNNEFWIVFGALLATVAFLYSSVGHGGASGYLALMAIYSFPISVIKPSALLLNLFVSGISFFFYYKKDFFKVKLFYPFAITSVPAAFIGGMIPLENKLYKILLGIVLIIAALRLFGFFKNSEKQNVTLNIPFAMGIGFGIGLLSGMLGIGGGVILSPILLFLGWATLKETAAISSLFIFVNSIAGLSGYFMGENTFPTQSFYLVPIAVFGGIVGAYYGSGYFSNKVLKYILATVIVLASIKLIV